MSEKYVKVEKSAFSAQTYHDLYQQSLDDPQAFWNQQARCLTWFRPWEEVCSGDFKQLNYQWFKGGQLNAAYNCLDRHLVEHAEKIAIIWEGDDPQQQRQLSYRELHAAVNGFANVLLAQGVQKGDRVCIYLPMIPEAAIAMLACARIGAIHSVVFAGFSAHALQQRILDADCRLVITADASFRGGKIIPLKANVDAALMHCPNVNCVIVVQHAHIDITWNVDRDAWYHEYMADADSQCPACVMDADDPLFILYTSGSTGKPKGVLHSTAGYLVHVALSYRYAFNAEANDIFWCTADIGWVTGHSYVIYGPLANGATVLMYEGVPHHPTPARFWQIIDKHRVTVFYTAPTAIRALMRESEDYIKMTTRKSLRLLGTVGEPINPEVWRWYYEHIGEQRCPIVDTWWQTETGGILIAPWPGAVPAKPGSAGKPFFGVVPVLLDEAGKEIVGAGEGILAIKQPWPGLMRTVYGDHARFIATYFQAYPGYYCTGDGARRDADDYFWISGRIDDVINVSGHRLGTAEIESALVLHSDIAEAAVVGVPHPIKGQVAYAYVIPKIGVTVNADLTQALFNIVRREIGAIAVPETIVVTDALPKTRSGKIMRRVLRQIAVGATDLGDISTLVNPEIVEKLIKQNSNA